MERSQTVEDAHEIALERKNAFNLWMNCGFQALSQNVWVFKAQSKFIDVNVERPFHSANMGTV